MVFGIYHLRKQQNDLYLKNKAASALFILAIYQLSLAVNLNSPTRIRNIRKDIKMLFSRKSNPQKIFDYKQFTIINKEFRKNFKSIFNTLDYFNNSVLKITSLELPSLLIDIEDFVYELNQSYLEESNYDSRAIYSYINNLNQKAIIIEIKTSKKK